MTLVHWARNRFWVLLDVTRKKQINWNLFLLLVHAAVIAINEAIEKGIAEQTLETLRNPNAVLTCVDDNLAQEYQKELWEAKKQKEENSRLKVYWC